MNDIATIYTDLYPVFLARPWARPGWIALRMCLSQHIYDLPPLVVRSILIMEDAVYHHPQYDDGDVVPAAIMDLIAHVKSRGMDRIQCHIRDFIEFFVQRIVLHCHEDGLILFLRNVVQHLEFSKSTMTVYGSMDHRGMLARQRKNREIAQLHERHISNVQRQEEEDVTYALRRLFVCETQAQTE